MTLPHDAEPAKQDPVADGVVRDSSMPRRRNARGERTRRRILNAAEAVFADLGYYDASIVRITEAAGVAGGTFYLYFESKQQVFEEVVRDLNHRVRQAMTCASEGASSRLEAERRGFTAFFEFTAEHPALYRLIRQAEFVSPETLRYHYERIISGYVPHLQAAMADGEIVANDPTVLAWALIAVGEMAGMKWILWDDNRSMPPEVFEHVMRVVSLMFGSSDPRGGLDPPNDVRPIRGAPRAHRKGIAQESARLGQSRPSLPKGGTDRRGS